MEVLTLILRACDMLCFFTIVLELTRNVSNNMEKGCQQPITDTSWSCLGINTNDPCSRFVVIIVGAALSFFKSFFRKVQRLRYEIDEPVLKQIKKVNFTPSVFSPPTPHCHFPSKMAVRLPTPKVDLSGSILDPMEILGGGDIRTTHPDVTTDSDLPQPGLYCTKVQ